MLSMLDFFSLGAEFYGSVSYFLNSSCPTISILKPLSDNLLGIFGLNPISAGFLSILVSALYEGLANLSSVSMLLTSS